ncbi:hypothetical protein [Limimaricola pyoseonensis]|uniref:Uncharacterized protein n=1 Tax=Limimaricola pyoseonensis TaxID=521013 RepID=A0A1G7CKE1_9RHOB|nr:hypothetical protein [Limimaricola pyoseonensis]SDE39713.1 hypothetical protein SAMN04488567_1535 [Limimaricola pyoseonensis]
MTRKPIAFGVLGLVAALIAADLAGSEPLNPYQAPPLMAYGSGLAATGAHCAASAVQVQE